MPSSAPGPGATSAPRSVSKGKEQGQSTRGRGHPGAGKGGKGRGPGQGAAAARGARGNLAPEARKAIEDMQRRIFTLADDDGSGTIQFTEFQTIHGEMTRLAADFSDGQLDNSHVMSREELVNQFRAHDADSSLGLDFAEWVKYTDAVLAVIGRQTFERVCAQLEADTQRRKLEREELYDGNLSWRLLEKVKQCKSLHNGSAAAAEVELLLQKKADINTCDKEGQFALLYAAEKSDVTFISKLIEAKAELKAHNKDYESAAFAAAKARNLEVFRLLVLADARPRADQHNAEVAAMNYELVSGMAKCSIEDCRRLLAKRADANYRDPSGWTALTAAVFWNKMQHVEAIISQQRVYGSSRLRINTQNPKGRSALHVAARKDLPEMVQVLVKEKADPNLQDIDGWTPLHHAAYNGNDACVNSLVDSGSNLTIRGNFGFTPWMVTAMPSRAGELRESALKRLRTSDAIGFTARILPILNNTEMNPYSKLEALLSLSGVNYASANLRLYEQYFSYRGPNKVRLQKTYECLAREMLERLVSGETDTREGGDHLSDAVNKDLQEERARRRRDQKAFIKQWFEDTKGPPFSSDWDHENREGYREALEKQVHEIVEASRERLDVLYDDLRNEAAGKELCALPLEEAVLPRYAKQTGAHPILCWLETLEVDLAFEALRTVRAAGMGKDDDDSLVAFMDLICANNDFDTGRAFWRNVYRLWLTHYAQLAQLDFQARIKLIVADFNKLYNEDGLTAAYTIAPPKTYDRVALKERLDLRADGDRDTHEGRTLAASCLDLVRTSVTVNRPEAIMKLLNEFFRPLGCKKNKLEVVRVVNRFHPEAVAANGYRDLVLNVLFDGGMRPTACQRPGPDGKPLCHQVEVVGEVQVNLEAFVAEKRRVSLLSKYLEGEFDHTIRRDRQVKAGITDDDVTSKGRRRPSTEPADGTP